jgi:PhnB protein
MSVSPIPEGFHSLTPYLVVDDGEKAIKFYEKAFGAKLIDKSTIPNSKKIMNAQLQIGDSMLMLCDEMPEQGSKGPNKLHGTTVMVHFYTPDATASWKRALDAGVEVVMPIDVTFWGDRYGMVRDPFGHLWSIASRVKKLSHAEMEAGAAKAFSHASMK